MSISSRAALGGFNSLSPTTQLILLGSVGVAGFLIYQKFFGQGVTQDSASAAALDSISVNQYALSRDHSAYRLIADNQFNLMNGYMTPFSNVLSGVQGLNTAELRQVAKEFGLRASLVTPIPWVNLPITQPQNIFQWYDSQFSGNELAQLHAVWDATGLWG